MLCNFVTILWRYISTIPTNVFLCPFPSPSALRGHHVIPSAFFLLLRSRYWIMLFHTRRYYLGHTFHLLYKKQDILFFRKVLHVFRNYHRHFSRTESRDLYCFLLHRSPGRFKLNHLLKFFIYFNRRARHSISGSSVSFGEHPSRTSDHVRSRPAVMLLISQSFSEVWAGSLQISSQHMGLSVSNCHWVVEPRSVHPLLYWARQSQDSSRHNDYHIGQQLAPVAPTSDPSSTANPTVVGCFPCGDLNSYQSELKYDSFVNPDKT